jgi:hypothetical protein
MNEQLTDLLYQSYPKIFAELHAPEEPRSMALGIMCGDGWFDLLDVLCDNLQFQTDRCGAPQIVASQVKEKFGELSFHRREASEAQRGMIAMAEAMSSRMCERCGKPGRTLIFNSLRQTVCPEHTPECGTPLGAGM